MSRGDWAHTLVLLPADIRAVHRACSERNWRGALRSLAEAQARINELRKTIEHADRAAGRWK